MSNHRHRVRNSRWNEEGKLEFFDNYFFNKEEALIFAALQDGYSVKVYNDDGEIVFEISGPTTTYA